MSSNPEFNIIIEVGLEALGLILENRLAGEILTSVELFYAAYIRAYQRSDFLQMDKMLSQVRETFSEAPDQELLFESCLLRLLMRRKAILPENLVRLTELYAVAGRWQGEVAMLLGSGWVELEDHRAAQTWFELAISHLTALGALKKACKARLNVLVSKSHLEPNLNLIPSYHEILRQALRIKEHSVAALCATNISREYQILGAQLAALKFATRAVEILNAEFGSKNFYLALAHRCHILIDLGRMLEARSDFESCMTSSFPEVNEVLKLLRPKFALDAEVVRNKLLPPTWQERASDLTGEFENKRNFTNLENQLVLFLSRGPRERGELLDLLYGSKLDYEVKLNRFKSLLTTLRKKFPTLVLCQKGHCSLAKTFTRKPATGA